MKRVVLLFAVLVAAGAALAWVLSAPKPRYSETEWQALGLAGDAAAGRLVFFAGGCESCHKSPGQDDPLRLGGGLELKTPFGSSIRRISRAIRPMGSAAGVRSISPTPCYRAFPATAAPLPAFPYTSYQRMTPKDVADLVAFLRTAGAGVGPRAGERPRVSVLDSPRRRLVEAAVFRQRRPSPDPARNRTMEPRPLSRRRAGPLRRVPHAARTSLARWKRRTRPGRRAGARRPRQVAEPPQRRLRQWTTADIVEALTSGFTPSGDVLGAGMTAVTRNLAEFPQTDREAIAVYLKSLPPLGPSASAKP